MQTALSFADLARPLNIGGVALPNRVFLAPMSGVTDRPFRRIAAEMGAGAVVSEMIAGDQLAGEHPVAALKAERAGDGPHIVQIAGRESHWMAEGARAATAAGADIIDINMGCPAKKVTGGYSGAALMRDLDRAAELIDATVGATDRPVTLKMRLGWDDNSFNAPELARRAEAAGVRMVTVHGRTRQQFYKGRADWAAIRRVKDAIAIPLIANGDGTSRADVEDMLAASGADGVMIGRGAYGRPWLPGQLAAAAAGHEKPTPTGSALRDLIVSHYRDMLRHYGADVGVRAARKHLGWYLEHLDRPVAPDLRRTMLIETDPERVIALLSTALVGASAECAA